MNYFRSLFLNFLTVFFINRMSPGIEIGTYDQVTNIGADILFSLIVGFLNASVFPFLFILELRPTVLKLALGTGLISFSAFGVISVISFGVKVIAPSGFFIGGGLVWLVAWLAHYLELRQDRDLNK